MRYPEQQLVDLIFEWLYRQYESYISIPYVLQESGYRNVDATQIKELIYRIENSDLVTKIRDDEFKLNAKGFEVMSNHDSYSDYIHEQQLDSILYFPPAYKPTIAERIADFRKLIIYFLFNSAIGVTIVGTIIATIITALILKHFKIG